MVYEYPSIEELAKYILALRSGDATGKSTREQLDYMLSLVDKWAATLVECASSGGASLSSGLVVVCGAFLPAAVLESDDFYSCSLVLLDLWARTWWTSSSSPLKSTKLSVCRGLLRMRTPSSGYS